MTIDHAGFMKLALEQAKRAAACNEVPIGAVVVHGEQVVAAAHNRREIDADPTAHAEILAMRQAAKHLGHWRLIDTTIYVTLEPCPMCAGALVNARVSEVVFGCTDPKAGAVRTLYALCEDPRLNHKLKVTGGVLADACAAILQEFFAKLRSTKIE